MLTAAVRATRTRVLLARTLETPTMTDLREIMTLTCDHCGRDRQYTAPGGTDPDPWPRCCGHLTRVLTRVPEGDGRPAQPAGHWREMERHTDAVLVATMPPALKAAVDDALAHGCTPQWILSLAHATAGGRTTPVLQIEAYLGIPQTPTPHGDPQ